jgi:flagellar basal-body rod protein FlgB
MAGKGETQMALNGIFDTTINLLGKSLDLRSENHNRISANIANAETPGYTPTTLSFEKELKDALTEQGELTPSQTNPRHFPLLGEITNLDLVQGVVLETSAGTPGRDGNGVELESEMGKMVGNQIMFHADLQLLTKKFQELTLAIKGGN